ncbi:MAG: hypothetical protein MUD16_02845 [Desulfobacterales bacterium]|jgi:hypothetical protein|nr:hypothetical protein [Desulfobacterales bacterium]
MKMDSDAHCEHRPIKRRGSLYMNGKEKRPYLQGALDGLCAIYSIVNAARIISDIGEEESKCLFRRILVYLEASEDLSRVLAEGIGLNTVGSILRDVANGRIPDRNMPFKHRPDTSLDEFWAGMMAFLDSGSKRAVLIGVGGRMWDHWSIVHAISEKQIYFFDSHKLKSLKRSRCTTVRPTAARPHLLCPTHTYFLS